MAAVQTQEAPSSMREYSYHVFLSFRGTDTRKNFTDHLYNALNCTGIHIFRDDDEIQRGKNIECEIEKAIQESKMSLIVFSKDYASSSYCLDEVVMIMKNRDAAGHIVLLVFYDVDPAEVADQTGSFAEAFSKHERDFTDDIKKVEGWRAALRKVTDLAGMVSHDSYEAQFIQDIVKAVGNQLKRRMLQVPPYLVGADSRVKDIDLWLQNRSSGVDKGIIYGNPGVGKTTIAKLVFNKNFENFDCWSFLMDIREISKQLDGKIKLQSQLLSDILKGKENEIHNADEGLAQIRDALGHKRVLIVLDDVDDVEQLRSIIQTWDWLYAGSKVIITTRHNRLFSDPEVFEKFRVQVFDFNESLQLFSWHAFREVHPPSEFRMLSKSLVQYCDGIPLALTVLGSSLYGRDKDFWERAIQDRDAIGGGKIQKIVGISYHSLQDDRDRTLFLDIACIFIGEDVAIVDMLIRSCNLYRKTGLDELIDRNLVSIDKDNKLMMHPLVLDMATDIIRKEAPEDHGQRTRIWDHDDAFKVLRNCRGTNTVRSLILRWSRVTIDSKDLLSLNTNAFVNMSNLKLLHLKNVRLSGDCRHFPKGLVYLRWHGIPLYSIPWNLVLEDLVVLDLSKSILIYAWDGIRMFPYLKVLNLSRCLCLIRTPDFRGLPGLEMLILMGCIALIEVNRSIEYLKNLVYVNLLGCMNLRCLPTLKPQTLVLTGFSRFYYQLPDQQQISGLSRRFSEDISLSNKLQNQVPTSFSLNLNRTPSFKKHNVIVNQAHQPHPLEYLDLVGNSISNPAGGNANFSNRTVMGPSQHLNVIPNSYRFHGQRMTPLSWQTSMYGYQAARLYNNPWL